jgi:hypothetical protein
MACRVGARSLPLGEDVLVVEGLERAPARLRQVAHLDEQGLQERLLTIDPGILRSEQGAAADEAHPPGQGARQQVTVGVDPDHSVLPPGQDLRR